MIGIVDGPARQPEHLLFQRAQDVERIGHASSLARNRQAGKS
jgi:hypothetical protein